MNLKNLSITVLVLAALSAVAYVLNRPAPPAETDPRVGEALLADATANAATAIAITDAGNTVELARADDDSWTVTSYHDLPADMDKLRRFVGELIGADIERVVTRNADRMARLDFGNTRLSITTPDTTWTVDLGRTAERGGRYLRFAHDEDSPAYLSPLSVYLDATARNWANSKLIGFAADDIASVELSFAEGAPVTVSRESANATWTTDDPPEGKRLLTTRMTSLLTSLTGLRFTDTTTPDDQDVVDASAHQRTAVLTNFEGESITIALGRRPEETTLKEPEADPAAILETYPDEDAGPAELLEDATETIPAGPVFAVVSGAASGALLATANESLAFKVSDYSFTSLPSRDDLFEDIPAPASETVAEE